MIKFGKGVVKYRVLILIVAFALLIPSGISFINTRINFDILSYLPSQIETMKGQLLQRTLRSDGIAVYDYDDRRCTVQH